MQPWKLRLIGLVPYYLFQCVHLCIPSRVKTVVVLSLRSSKAFLCVARGSLASIEQVVGLIAWYQRLSIGDIAERLTANPQILPPLIIHSKLPTSCYTSPVIPMARWMSDVAGFLVEELVGQSSKGTGKPCAQFRRPTGRIYTT